MGSGAEGRRHPISIQFTIQELHNRCRAQPELQTPSRGYLVPTELLLRQDMLKLNSSITSLLHFLFDFFCKNYQQHCEIFKRGRRKLQSRQQVTRTFAFPLTLQGSGKACRALLCSWQNITLVCNLDLAASCETDPRYVCLASWNSFAGMHL